MDLSDKNILNVYKNYEISNYILNNFTDKNTLSIFKPNDQNLYKPKGIYFPGNIIDQDNEYKINELGFRGNLKNNAEILAVGCSYTFGVGVPEDGTWPNLLGSEINKDILNLGIPGATIKQISELIIKYVSKYDKPKTIFAFFPPIFRTSLIEDVEFYSSTKNINPKKQKQIDRQSSFQSKIFYNINRKEIFFEKEDYSPFSKSKEKGVRYMENVFSPHQLISDSIDSISIIEDFCYSHGIELYWSMWDNPSSMLMDVLVTIPNFKLKKYIKFADDKFSNYQTKNNIFPNNFCSLSHNSNLVNHSSWNVGSDITYSYGKPIKDVPSHPGIHFQHHVADLFKSLLI
jgi:hypothetical protein